MLTAREVAREHGLTVETLYKWRRRSLAGDLVGPSSFKRGDRILYWRSDVDAWLAGAIARPSAPNPVKQERASTHPIHPDAPAVPVLSSLRGAHPAVLAAGNDPMFLISKTQKQRALLILHSLAQAAVAAGWQVNRDFDMHFRPAQRAQIQIVCPTTSCELRLMEHRTRESAKGNARDRRWGEPVWTWTGLLQLGRYSERDGTPLEQRLPEIMSAMYVSDLAAAQERRDYNAGIGARAERDRAARTRQAEQNSKAALVRRLTTEAQAWEAAAGLRRYLDAVAARLVSLSSDDPRRGTIEEFLSSASRAVDDIDPLRSDRGLFAEPTPLIETAGE